jgi:heme exporter protein A
MKIELKSISKSFGYKQILKNINLELSSESSVAIIGPNGSGKSTLIRIICGLLRPTSGLILLSDNNQFIFQEKHFNYIRLVAPYLELYERLTALENIIFFARLQNIKNIKQKILELFSLLHLNGYENEQVKNYSSGMKQRLKYIVALLSNPALLILDEPTSYLDEEGMHIIYRIMEEQKKENILIFATNNMDEIKYGDKIIELTL